ncbi:MAG: prepilin peptidase, partial [Patescibacteria group bacterium]
MTTVLTVSFFVLGAIVASFIGVVVARMHTGQSFFIGRSRCDACNAILAPHSLIPLISFMTARGRANCCGARLSPIAPISEGALGGFFALSYLTLGISITLVFMLLSLSILLVLVLYDLAHQILPPSLLGAFVVVSAGAAFVNASSITLFLEMLRNASFIAAVLAAIHLLSRGRAIGFSDAPLAFGLALLVGPSAFSGFIFSFWIGAVIGIVLLLKRPKGSRMGVEVPF